MGRIVLLAGKSKEAGVNEFVSFMAQKDIPVLVFTKWDSPGAEVVRDADCLVLCIGNHTPKEFFQIAKSRSESGKITFNFFTEPVRLSLIQKRSVGKNPTVFQSLSGAYAPKELYDLIEEFFTVDDFVEKPEEPAAEEPPQAVAVVETPEEPVAEPEVKKEPVAEVEKPEEPVAEPEVKEEPVEVETQPTAMPDYLLEKKKPSKVKKWFLVVSLIVVVCCVGLYFVGESAEEVKEGGDTWMESDATLPVNQQASGGDDMEPATPVENEAAEDSPVVEEMHPEAVYFEGAIDGKYNVQMELNPENGNGIYYYTKYGPSNSLSLTFRVTEEDGMQVMYITEYNGDGVPTGRWKGVLQNGVYSGTGVFNGVEMPFVMRQYEP